MIMMQMTDFTRGTGPLKNTSDVIEAAKDIARLGNDLEALASQISEVIWLILTSFSHNDAILFHYDIIF